MDWLVKVGRVVGLLLAFVGCAEEFVGTQPPKDGRFYYPGRMTVSQDGNTVYIVNTNFDQQFTAGWISVLDVPTLVNALASGQDPNVAIDPNRMLRVPTLGGQLALDPNGDRAYLPSRGTGLLTTIEITNGQQLSCGDNTHDVELTYALQRTDCDSAHIFNFTDTANAAPNIAAAGTFNYAANADPVGATWIKGDTNTPSYLAVGFLSSNQIALIDPSGPITVNSLKRMVTLSMNNTSVLALEPAGPGQLIASNHVTSANGDRATLYFVNADASVKGDADVYTSYSLNVEMGGFEITSMHLQDGNMLFATTIAPDGLAAVQLGINSTYTAQTLMNPVAVDGSHPTGVLYLKRASGDLVVMPALQQDALYFFAVQNGRPLLVQRVGLPDGKGPFDVQLVSGKVNGADKAYLLVTTFFDHGMSIIDVSSPNYTQFSVVGTIHQGDLGVAPRFR